MKCERIRELMSAYIDNEINEVDKVKFEKHIAQCPQCKEEYELLLDIVKECSKIDEEELPEGFREELHNKLLHAENSKSRGLSSFIRRNKWRVYGGATAAAVLVFALSFSALNAPKIAQQTADSASPFEAGNAPQYSLTKESAGSEQNQMGIAALPQSAPDMEAESAPEPAPAAEPSVKAAPTANETRKDLTFSEDINKGGNDTKMRGLTFEAPIRELANKIIKNGNLSLKVSDVQTTIDQIASMTEQLGGYVDSSYVSDVQDPIVYEDVTAKEKAAKVGSMTIKVPADKFESTFQSILAMGTVVNQSTDTSDITKQYMDMESRLSNLKVQEKNYQELLSKAQNVEEMLKVETELNRIRTEIDIMQGDIKRWDEQVEYSTIYINLTEVKEAELEKVDTSSVWQRARRGLISTVNNIKNAIAWLFVFLISALPYIAILGAAALLAVLWVRRKKE